MNTQLENAYQYCQNLANNHYENFPVASRLIPAQLRPHITAIYAFARTADDFADIDHDRGKILDWRKKLFSCQSENSDNPIFIALANTIKEHQLPVEWLDDLLTAFLLDLDKNRYASFDELLQYCHYSANPVGKLLLWLFQIRSESAINAANAITSALQLTNFWQDISIDLNSDRIYIPQSLIKQFGMSDKDLISATSPAPFSGIISEAVKFTDDLFNSGTILFPHLSGRLLLELKLTWMGGKKILSKVEKLSGSVIFERPKLNKMDWMGLLLRMFFKVK